MMLRLVIAVACLAVLTACDSMPKRTKIGVSTPCEVQLPEKPVWATDALPKGAKFRDMAKAALAELEQHKAYEAKLEAAARSCS